MSGQRQDSDLRERYEAMRRDDASRAPRFTELLAHAKGEAAQVVGAGRLSARVHWRRFGWATGLVAAAAIAALILIPRGRSDEAAFEQAVQAFQTDPALGAWRSPTAGLLDLPGRDLISTMPRVGAGGP